MSCLDYLMTLCKKSLSTYLINVLFLMSKYYIHRNTMWAGFWGSLWTGFLLGRHAVMGVQAFGDDARGLARVDPTDLRRCCDVSATW